MNIFGRNAVREALASGKTIEKVYVAKGNFELQINTIVAMCREKGILVSFVDGKILEKLSENGVHQGVLAITTEFEYVGTDDILAYAEERGEPPFIVLLDGITDPHNLGAIIRSSECMGVHGIIIPKHRAAGVNDTVVKVSCGATEYVKIAKETNINDVIRYLKKQNVWVYGAEMNGQPIDSVNLTGGLAIVIGSEGDGISRLTKELCDGLISIPQFGKINSLNASVAAGICLYEAAKQRK